MFNMWDAAAHGGVFNKERTADGLYFFAQSMEREINTLKGLLGFAERKPRFEVDDDDREAS